MHIADELINELAELYGIIHEYWDIFGKKHITSVETKKAILKAMKLNVDSTDNINYEINLKKRGAWNLFVPMVKVISINEQPIKIPIYIHVKEGEENNLLIKWSLEDEHGQKDYFVIPENAIFISDQRYIDGMRYIKIELKDKGNRDIGYYSATVSCRTTDSELIGSSRLIIAPDACYIPPELDIPSSPSLHQGERASGDMPELVNGKTWGLSLNLYSMRSSQNWGVGDFNDLRRIIKWISDLKGGFVGINPLHAIPNKKPFGISPYSPISRLYKNFIYLDIENIPEVKELMAHGSEVEAMLNELRDCELIDYEKVAPLKISVLRSAFEIFYREHYLKDSARCKNFVKYVSQEGDNLESFATYVALSEQFGVQSSELEFEKLFSWQKWPEQYRILSSDSVQEFRKTHEKDMLFYFYVQWLIDEQLKEISELAKNLGMPVGIYHDLAIGSIGGGSDAWMSQGIIADSIDLGAPPDDFNPAGQNWGLPPLIPEKLKESGYAFFIQTIRKNMKHFGALRIDHALGMFRQFWIPKDMPASKGAYVTFPSEDLLRIIALESVKNKTMVIAEDLGTIGENVRESLLRFRMLSYKLLYFERNYPDPSFTPPDKYPDMALCAVTTHDLPTLYGWWTERDIEIKKRLGIYLNESAYQSEIGNREKDKALLLDALLAHGSWLIAHSKNKDHQLSAMTPELCLAIYEYLARTPCKLLAVSLDDVIGALDQQNMPGITDLYPSWTQKTPISLEQIFSNKCFSSMSKMFQKNNR